MKKIVILGSTGSIGTQALDVIRKNRDRFSVRALSCGHNISRLRDQIEEFSPEAVCVADSSDAASLSKDFPGVSVLSGSEGLDETASAGCDILINALVGIAGLSPTYSAIKAGNDIALANKETLVTGGEFITAEAERRGVRIVPVDSEHSAIFQSLQGNEGNSIRRILLTASGGPFRTMPAERFRDITPEMALAHPNWSMGKKITIDSATMMNKGFEVIEAKWLFGVPLEKVQVLIHPQSIVHSAVEYEDGAVMAQLGMPDMRIPIQYALTYPERLPSDFPKIDFFRDARELTFEEPDTEKFKCLRLAYEAQKEGGTAPAAMNAANEVLVRLFLEGKIKFTDIPDTIEAVLERHCCIKHPGIEEIIGVDRESREYTLSALGIGE
ncbi:MAG: 1-deoxy-D-xylulose-5-phosphate reductoisomerase [Anaerovoracaceae bacterium]|jgi:1-deoxy-D-xylulose-5-phosphate reductoisomerase